MNALDWVRKRVRNSSQVITPQDIMLYKTYSVNLERGFANKFIKK